MSSTESDFQAADGWGIDWRFERTWMTLVGTSLQLGLIAAMAAVISVGLATRILPDWHFLWLSMWALAGASLLPFFLFYGWVIPPVKQGGEETSDRGFRYKDGSKADQIVFCCWSGGMMFAVTVLGGGLLALFNLDMSLDLFTVFVAIAPALYVTNDGFPYVLDRLRQTAAKARVSDR